MARSPYDRRAELGGLPSPDDTAGTDAQWAPMSDEAWASTAAGERTDAGAWEPPDVAGAADANAASPYGAQGADPYGTQGADPYGTQAAGPSDPYATTVRRASAAEPSYQRQDTAPRAPVPSPPQQEPYVPGRHRSRRERAGQTSGAAYDGVPSPYTGGDVPPAGTAAPSRGSAPAPRGPRPARHGCLSMLLWLAMLVVGFFMTLRLLPLAHSTGKHIPELVSFVPLMLVPTVVCLALALLWRRRVLAVLCALALVVNGFWHAGYLLPGTSVSSAAGTAVASAASTEDGAARIMTLNTLNGRASAADIVRVCKEQHVEVLCLQELTDGMVSDLENAGIDAVLPYHVVSTGASSVSNGGRNGIWTLAPISNVSRNLLPIETSSMPAVNVTIGQRTVRVVSVHPNSPTRGAQDLWNEGLSVIGSLSDYDHAYLIMGDFNSTWDHARFRELLGSSFVDASQSAGEGFHMTYPANSKIPPLIEIDHIVYARDSGIAVSDLQTVEIRGSDHMALLGTLEVS